MDDPRRATAGDEHKLQQPPASVSADDQQSLLPLVLVLDVSQSVAPGMADVFVCEAMSSRALLYVHVSKTS